MTSIRARNVNHPGYRENLNQEKYGIIRGAILAALPAGDSREGMAFPNWKLKSRRHWTDRLFPCGCSQGQARYAGTPKRCSWTWKRAVSSSGCRPSHRSISERRHRRGIGRPECGGGDAEVARTGDAALPAALRRAWTILGDASGNRSQRYVHACGRLASTERDHSAVPPQGVLARNLRPIVQPQVTRGLSLEHASIETNPFRALLTQGPSIPLPRVSRRSHDSSRTVPARQAWSPRMRRSPRVPRVATELGPQPSPTSDSPVPANARVGRDGPHEG